MPAEYAQGRIRHHSRNAQTGQGGAGNPLITAADSTVYAFALTNPASLDSAVITTLPPGSYTVQAKSASATAGVALIEIYDVP